MKSIYWFWIGMVITGFSITFPTTAGIVVLPNIINFTIDELPRKDVTVINEGEEEAYIKVTPHIILEPGSGRERKVIIRDPDQYGLLVTPQQLIIPPKQQRLIRLMLTQPLNEQERIYGVDIVPIAKEIVPTGMVKKNGRNMGLQLLVGYGVLAMARPVHPQLNIQIHRKDKMLVLHNKGNANVEISKIEQCSGTTCSPVKNFSRLHAGKSNQIPLNRAAPVKMLVQLLDEQKKLISN